MSGNLVFGQDRTTNSIHALGCDSNGHLDVNIATVDPATGLATEAKQDDMITDLTQIATNTSRLAPQLNRTEAIPVQIMVGSGGANYDALRANGQDLMVMIDDMNPDVAVNSGLSTAINQTNGNQVTKCMGIDTATSLQHQLKVASDGALHIISENFDSMLIKGVQDGTTTQKDAKTNSNGDLRSALIGNTAKDGTGTNYYVLVDTDGKLVTSGGGGGGGGTQYDQGDALGATPTGTLSMAEDSSGNAYPIQVSATGELQVQTLRAADSTAVSTTPVLANATFTSASVDMNGFSQLTIVGNTTNLSDPMNWQVSLDDITFFTGEQVVYDFTTGDFAEQPNNGAGVGGARYFRVTQTDTLASNFTVQFASSKR